MKQSSFLFALFMATVSIAPLYSMDVEQNSNATFSDSFVLRCMENYLKRLKLPDFNGHKIDGVVINSSQPQSHGYMYFGNGQSEQLITYDIVQNSSPKLVALLMKHKIKSNGKIITAVFYPKLGHSPLQKELIFVMLKHYWPEVSPNAFIAKKKKDQPLVSNSPENPLDFNNIDDTNLTIIDKPTLINRKD